MTTDELYPLDRSLTESARLNRQHRILAHAGCFLHPGLDLSSCTHILDHAAGTGIWCTAVITERSDQLRAGCTFELADLSSAQFPDPLPPRVTDAYLHSAVEPFPAEKRERYDLVHQRFLWSGLKRDEWLPALEQLKTALKPGGKLSLHEMQAAVYRKVDNTSSRPIYSETDQGMYRITERFSDIAGVDIDLVHHLPDLLKQAGFVDIQPVYQAIPVGPVAAHLGDDYVRESVDNIVDAATRVSTIGFQKGMFSDFIPTEKALRQTLDETFGQMRSEGGYWPHVLVIARKP